MTGKTSLVIAWLVASQGGGSRCRLRLLTTDPPCEKTRQKAYHHEGM